MKGRLIDLAVSRTGKQRLTIELDGDFTEGYDKLHGSDINLAVKKWKPIRSLNANAYFHALVNQIAELTGETEEEVKRDLAIEYGAQATMVMLPYNADIEMFYPYYRLVGERENNGKPCKIYALYKHTRDMDSKEFSRLLEGTITEAKLLGIDTETQQQKSIIEGE